MVQVELKAVRGADQLGDDIGQLAIYGCNGICRLSVNSTITLLSHSITGRNTSGYKHARIFSRCVNCMHVLTLVSVCVCVCV